MEAKIKYSEDGTILEKCPIYFKGDVVIPNHVVKIADRAFDSCIFLTSVIIPDSVTTIGDLAFYKCKNLKNVEISCCAFMNSYTFRHCSFLNNDSPLD